MRITFLLQPILSVPVCTIRAAIQLWAPPAVHALCALASLYLMVGQTRPAVLVGVAGMESFKYNGGFILYFLVFHVDPVVFVDCLPSCNYNTKILKSKIKT